MTTVRRALCEYLLPVVEVECSGHALLALSVRAQLSDVWQVWGVCPQHVDELAADLLDIGFVVTVPYAWGDDEACATAEDYADRFASSVDGWGRE